MRLWLQADVVDCAELTAIQTVTGTTTLTTAVANALMMSPSDF